MLELFKCRHFFRHYVYIPVVATKHVLVGTNPLIIIVKRYKTISLFIQSKNKNLNVGISEVVICGLVYSVNKQCAK